jgi:uncharacterized surface protein with fasciclin (FAS1) repeats
MNFTVKHLELNAFLPLQWQLRDTTSTTSFLTFKESTMNTKRLFINALAAFSIVTALSACGGDDDHPAPAKPSTIVDVAKEKGFNALLAAATKAELVATLSAPDANLTVFAPTDTAFTDLATKLGFASATAMVEALPKSALANILTYHVIGAKKLAADLQKDGANQSTLYNFSNSASKLSFNFTNGVTITDAALTTAKVAIADVPASNGVIHAIDKVLVPPGVLNIVQMAQVNPLFAELVKAVVASNLQGTLSSAGPFTVFAPTNAAFAAAPSVTPTQLTTVLTYHVLGSQVLSTQIPFGTAVNTVANQAITINQTPLTITDKTNVAAKIVAVDVRASNGVIHVIDKVLIPTL